MIGLLLTIALVGLIVWALVKYVPMPDAFRTIIVVVAVILLVIYLLGVLGVGDIPVPRLH
jgi:heme A synthase